MAEFMESLGSMLSTSEESSVCRGEPQGLWQLVVMQGVRDLLRMDSCTELMAAFEWFFYDEDSSRVMYMAGIEPDHFRPRLAALVLANCKAAEWGQPIMVKSSTGMQLRREASKRQKRSARHLLDSFRAAKVFHGVRAKVRAQLETPESCRAFIGAAHAAATSDLAKTMEEVAA